MMDEVKGLSAGMRFALTRQLAARCVVLMAYVLAGYCVPWLWGLILALVSGGHYVVEYHVLGPTLVMCAVLTAVLAVSGFRSLISMGVGRAVYFWTEMFANLCFSLACSVVMTLGFVLTPNHDADILITFRVGSDLQWLACVPPSDSFGRLRFLNRDLGGSYAAMRTGVRGDTANPMLPVPGAVPVDRLGGDSGSMRRGTAGAGQSVRGNRPGGVGMHSMGRASMAVEQNRHRCQSDDMETARGTAGTLVSDVA